MVIYHIKEKIQIESINGMSKISPKRLELSLINIELEKVCT